MVPGRVGFGGDAPYAPVVEEQRAAHDRAARLAERNRRRAAAGRQTWEAPPEAFSQAELWTADERATTLVVAANGERARPPAGHGLARSAAIFSLATALSRVFGLVRQVVAAYYFGAQGR